MSLSSEERNFVDTYKQWADQAADALKINVAIVLGQWALESGWAPSSYPGVAVHNIAGITSNGTNLIPYSDWAQFVQAYIRVMKNDCPLIREGKSSNSSTASEVFANTTYNTADPTYASTIQSIADMLEPALNPEPEQAGSSDSGAASTDSGTTASSSDSGSTSSVSGTVSTSSMTSAEALNLVATMTVADFFHWLNSQ